jgi:endonuclease/exonuclease/phosphatase family metal-dependent hydrolase
MRRLFLILALMGIQLLASQALARDDLRVGTFNIRTSGAADGFNDWTHRRGLFVQTVRRFDPDLLGLQEVRPDQQKHLETDLADYGTIATYRDAGPRAEACSLFYRRDRFDLVDSGTFWLSETPDKVGSRGWDAALPRVCTWARLRDRTAGRELLLANTHLDHAGMKARVNAAKLICARLGALAKETPVVLLGDFNAIETGPVYAALLDASKRNGIELIDTYRAVRPERQADELTYHAFKGDTWGQRIDWIFQSPTLEATDCKIDRGKSEDGRFPSDHYAVWATLRYVKPPASQPR